MTELINSRCLACSPKAFQCSPCAVNDQTLRKAARTAKKMQHQPQTPNNLFASTAPVVAVSAFVAPIVPVDAILLPVEPPLPLPSPLSDAGLSSPRTLTPVVAV